MEVFMKRNNIDHVTGAAARNQMYCNFMTLWSVKDPKKSYTRAPEYIQARAKAAFTYGDQNTPEDVISSEYIAPYNTCKGSYNDDDLQEIMDLLIAGVKPAE